MFMQNIHTVEPLCTAGAACWHDASTQCARAGNEPYAFTKWSDDSAPLPVLDGSNLTKLYLTKSYGFQDAAATDQYNRAFDDFKRRTPTDQHMDFSTRFSVDGFKEHTLCHLGDGGSPWWVSSGCFALASVFCCSFLFRTALDRAVVAHNHKIRKFIGA